MQVQHHFNIQENIDQLPNQHDPPLQLTPSTPAKKAKKDQHKASSSTGTPETDQSYDMAGLEDNLQDEHTDGQTKNMN